MQCVPLGLVESSSDSFSEATDKFIAELISNCFAAREDSIPRIYDNDLGANCSLRLYVGLIEAMYFSFDCREGFCGGTIHDMAEIADCCLTGGEHD